MTNNLPVPNATRRRCAPRSLWTALFAGACLASAPALVAAQTKPDAPAPNAGGGSAVPVPKIEERLSDADLEELLAPIALYPDVLLANTLATCVYVDDLRAAYQAMSTNRPADDATKAGWDQSVQTIAGFPEVLKLLGENMPWAEAIGQANVLLGPDVMKAVQTLRARAWQTGALATNEQHTVVTEGTTIIIEPAKPEIIYVPQYNPQVVYVQQSNSNAVAAGLIGFGVGVAITAIFCDVGCNWGGGCICWGWGHHHHGGFNNNDINININNNNNWNNVNVNRPGQNGQPWRPNPDKVKPDQWRRDGKPPAYTDFKGIGSGTAKPSVAKVPGRADGARPIAAAGKPAAPRPRPATTARPSAPTPAARPTTPNAPAAKPNIPAPAKPAARPAAPPAAKPSIPSAPRPQPSGLRPGGGSGAKPSGSGGGSRPAPRPAPRPSRGK